APKRVDLLIRAMRLARTPLPLLIAGTGRDEARLRDLAAGDGRIRFLGPVPDDALVALYGASLAVPFVPYDEDYGLVAIEAMTSGKPVITGTDSGGPLAFVADGETGLVVPPVPEALARAIDRLASDVDEARRMGRSAPPGGAVDGPRRVGGGAGEGGRDIPGERTVAALLEDRGRGRARVVSAASRGDASRPGRAKIAVAVPFAVYPPLAGGQLRIVS